MSGDVHGGFAWWLSPSGAEYLPPGSALSPQISRTPRPVLGRHPESKEAEAWGAAYVPLQEGDSEVVSDAIPESAAQGPQIGSRILGVSRGGTCFDATTLESSFQIH